MVGDAADVGLIACHGHVAVLAPPVAPRILNDPHGPAGAAVRAVADGQHRVIGRCRAPGLLVQATVVEPEAVRVRVHGD